MGGKSKSSSKTNTTTNSTNVSGQNAISGDSYGTNLSGVNNSTIKLTTTDHGAIKNALSFGESIADDAFSFGEKSLNAMSISNRNSLEFAGEALDEMSDFSGKALDDISSNNSESLQTLAGLSGQQAVSNSENLTAVMNLAKFNADGGASENELLDSKNLMYIIGAVAVVSSVAIYSRKH